MSKAMETIAEHLYAIDESVKFDEADAQQIKTYIDAYVAGKKSRP